MEFSLPIRVRWDVDFRERSGRVKRSARKIAEASPLFVELHISGKRGLSELSGILAELQKAGPRVSVHLGLSPGSTRTVRNGYPITEDAFYYDWAGEMLPYIQAGKPVFAAEYTDLPGDFDAFCRQSEEGGFSTILKNRGLDAWVQTCQ